MSTAAPSPGLCVQGVQCTDDELIVRIADGRTISVPLVWFPRLLGATPAERAHWELAGAGFGIHWPEIDEDVSVEDLLRGGQTPRGHSSVSR